MNIRALSVFLLSILLLFFPLKTSYPQDAGQSEGNRGNETAQPVYKPLISLGVGTFGFDGNVNDFHRNAFSSPPGMKLNISTFIDNQRYFMLNFYLLRGHLTGNERSFIDPEQNLNFRSEIMNFGMNLEYSFRHLFPSAWWITPFISLGAESFQFSSKGDLHDSQGRRYNYWSDGTIRDLPESSPVAHESVVIRRNYIYETDLRRANIDGLGDYPQISLALPIGYGLNFRVSERIGMRVASSIHFTLTDLIDNVRTGGGGFRNLLSNDRFVFSYVSINMDLFSDRQTKMTERLMAGADIDHSLTADEDGDGVPDFWDKCPGTPRGVKVDRHGCPVDSDGDGVPDYRDLEPGTPAGAMVDEYGREIRPADLAELLEPAEDAVTRDEAGWLLSLSGELYPYQLKPGYDGIPEKFAFLDTNNDGFISFEELILAIDLFFDGGSGLSVDDIYELNEFFFSQ